MGVDTEEIRFSCCSNANCPTCARNRSADDELDKMRTALAMEPHVSEQLDAERAAHEATKRELSDAREVIEGHAMLRKDFADLSQSYIESQNEQVRMRARLESAEAILDAGSPRDAVRDHFARFGTGGGR